MSFTPVSTDLDATPLGSLPAIVLDTETTGLDTKNDRIVEIGAVRLDSARIGLPDTYAALVRPDVPIPEPATGIHGISDADVASAAPFSEAMPAFTRWAGPRIVIGYSIGFDLAILAAEHGRRGMPWTPPRVLDVRHLLQALAPNLPDDSLETIANWLGVEVANRHRALGDAQATADVFRALVPRLRDRGITTLAEAERACRSLTARLDTEAAAGWVGGGLAADTFRRIDSFPYRHRVRDLMASPPLSVADDTTLRDAITTMTEHKVSSLVFQPRDGTTPPGIVTERDVLRAIVRSDAAALTSTVVEVGSRPLVTVDADEYVYRAMTRMSAGGFRHLGVTETDGALIGVLSARDLLRQRAQEAVSIGDAIDRAATKDDLGRVWSKLTPVVRSLVEEKVDVRDVAAIISRELRALCRRACDLSLEAMQHAGHGPPPTRFAVLVLGSGGRGESLLAMDQDNAIVYGDSADTTAADRWFETFARGFSDILNDVGVSYCSGGVMASKAEWRRDVAGWRDTIGSWLTRSRPEDILRSDIFFDAVAVYGDEGMAETLWRDAVSAAQDTRVFLRLLALNAAKVEPPIGLFGRFRSQEGRIDLKLGGVMAIFSAARVLALQHGLDAAQHPSVCARRAPPAAPPQPRSTT